jgi:5-(carboxyamino)imidazole ribonucleotide mutase
MSLLYGLETLHCGYKCSEVEKNVRVPELNLISTLSSLATYLWRGKMRGKVVILMGSGRDVDFCKEIAEHAKSLGLQPVLRVGSAHKTPERVLQILKEYEKLKVVFITVAGRSNALSAFVDANTAKPVIACPPYSEKYSGMDVLSSLRVPSGIASLVIVEPEGAALAAAKILAVQDQELERCIREYQQAKRKEIEKADEFLKRKS